MYTHHHSHTRPSSRATCRELILPEHRHRSLTRRSNRELVPVQHSHALTRRSRSRSLSRRYEYPSNYYTYPPARIHQHFAHSPERTTTTVALAAPDISLYARTNGNMSFHYSRTNHPYYGHNDGFHRDSYTHHHHLPRSPSHSRNHIYPRQHIEISTTDTNSSLSDHRHSRPRSRSKTRRTYYVFSRSPSRHHRSWSRTRTISRSRSRSRSLPRSPRHIVSDYHRAPTPPRGVLRRSPSRNVHSHHYPQVHRSRSRARSPRVHFTPSVQNRHPVSESSGSSSSSSSTSSSTSSSDNSVDSDRLVYRTSPTRRHDEPYYMSGGLGHGSTHHPHHESYSHSHRPPSITSSWDRVVPLGLSDRVIDRLNREESPHREHGILRSERGRGDWERRGRRTVRWEDDEDPADDEEIAYVLTEQEIEDEERERWRRWGREREDERVARDLAGRWRR